MLIQEHFLFQKLKPGFLIPNSFFNYVQVCDTHPANVLLKIVSTQIHNLILWIC